MSRQAMLHPRFSAKAAFDGNIIDASDGEYATHKAKNYPRNTQCSAKTAQPAVQVQAVRRARPVITPTDEDREHWKGKNVVAQTQKVAVRQRPRVAQPIQRPQSVAAPAANPNNQQPRSNVTAPGANPDNRVWAQEMGRREVQHQKVQRAARMGASVPEQNANSFVATVPRELLESESFILEMPQSALRYHELANEAEPRLDEEEIVEDDEDLQANRQYWGGKQVVQQPRARQCAAPQQPRVVARGPGCQQRAAPATKDTLRAVPKKVVPRQTAVPQKTVVQAKKKAAPVKRGGGCPCNQ